MRKKQDYVASSHSLNRNNHLDALTLHMLQACSKLIGALRSKLIDAALSERAKAVEAQAWRVIRQWHLLKKVLRLGLQFNRVIV